MRNSTKLVVAAALTLSSVGAQTIGDRPVELPVAYDEDRFYVTPMSKDGVAIRFFADTGGGCSCFPMWPIGNPEVMLHRDSVHSSFDLDVPLQRLHRPS